jgi:hypothetical protein
MTKAVLVAGILAVCMAAAGSAQTPKPEEKETGMAAVYAPALNGHATASGQLYDPAKLTASHPTLPFGSTVRVTNPATRQSVVLRINDRAPKQAGRVIEISQAAAARLGIDRRVMREVTVALVALGSGKTASRPASIAAASADHSQAPDDRGVAESTPLRAAASETGSSPAGLAAAAAGGPPDAVPGQCYAKVIIPARFETRGEQVVKVPAGKRLEVVPPTYKTVTEQVLISPEYTRTVPVPATYKTVTEEVVVVPAGTRTEPVAGTYKTVTEQVEVTPASVRMEIVPATYKSVSEQVVIRPERKELKSIPATYKMVEETVLDRPASTNAVAVPATFKDVTEQVLVRPASTRYEPIAIPLRAVTEDALRSDASVRIETSPTTLKTATERVVVKEASKRLVEVPAVFETVSERVKVADAHAEWKRGRSWLGQAREVRPVKGFVLDAGGKTAGGKPVEPKSRKLAKDSVDDDVMCLVEVPAKYEVVTRKVLKTPASVREVTVPAEYTVVTRQVVDAEASSRSVDIPATYQKVTRSVIDVEALKTRGYKFDANGDIVATPEGDRVLRASALAGATAVEKTAGAASGEEAYVREIMVPAEYRTVTRQVLDQPATVRMVTVAPTHKTITRRVVDVPAHTEEVTIPAEHRTVTRQVIDVPESSREVKIAAVYKSVTRQVVDTPPTTREVPVPAVTRTLTHRVIDVAAHTREEVVPAVYKSTTRQVVDTPATTREVDVPAVFDTNSSIVKVSEPSVAWHAILCETNATPDKLREIQRALQAAGFNPGPIDGVIQDQTMKAINAYQAAKGLSVDPYLTIETVSSLGVSPK